MPTFPTLSTNPSVEGWGEEAAFDPAIRNKVEAGYVASRPKFTRIPKKWGGVYKSIPNADKNLIETFEFTEVYCGSTNFNWTNPLNSTVYDVRFLGTIKYDLAVETEEGYRWDVTFTVEQV
jgi:hypothetical protein